MPRYLVEWHIDAEDAIDPHDAARYAREMQLDPGSAATIFHVTNTVTGDQTVVDLLDDQPAEDDHRVKRILAELENK